MDAGELGGGAKKQTSYGGDPTVGWVERRMVNQESWIETGYQPPIPVVDPRLLDTPEAVIFMPFPKKARNFWMRVAGDKCQTMVYDERHGWRTCDRPAEEVDHIIPEKYQLEQGDDPNNSVGMPRCKTHHVSDGRVWDEEDNEWRTASWGEWEWSKHPDVAEALEQYRAGNADAFQQLGIRHAKAAKEGEHYWNTDEATDAWETERMLELAQRLGEKRPSVKPHARVKK